MRPKKRSENGYRYIHIQIYRYTHECMNTLEHEKKRITLYPNAAAWYYADFDDEAEEKVRERIQIY